MEPIIVTETLDFELEFPNDPYFPLSEADQVNYGCIG